jgi:hypothetical protein
VSGVTRKAQPAIRGDFATTQVEDPPRMAREGAVSGADTPLALTRHALVVVRAGRSRPATDPQPCASGRAGGVVGAVGRGAAVATHGVGEALSAGALAGEALGSGGARRPWPGRDTGVRCGVAVAALAVGTCATGPCAAVRDLAEAAGADQPRRTTGIAGARRPERTGHRARRHRAGRRSWGEHGLQHGGRPHHGTDDGTAAQQGTTSQPLRIRRSGTRNGTPGLRR